MKKQIIFGLILVGGLILLGAGCTVARENGQINANANANKATNEAVEPAGVEPGVTEEELNQLKADINEMDYEDLNALTK